jgi:hypothetical protein
MRFARAAELARFGRYREAEGLLSRCGQEPSDPNEIDLLARISARQRHYRRARCLWEIALKRSPGNADYERAIKRTRAEERWQARLRQGMMVALLSLAAIALFISVRKSFHWHAPSGARAGDKQSGIRAKPTPVPSSSSQPAAALPQTAPTASKPSKTLNSVGYTAAYLFETHHASA